LTASTISRPRAAAATRVVAQRRPASRLSSPRKPGRPTRRLACTLVVTVLAFSAVLVRVGTLQTVDAARYTALGEAQRVRAVVLPAERGTIFDRNGAELALTVPKKTVWADPRLVADPGKAAGLLAPILGADAAALATRLSRTADFVYVARQIDDTEAQRIAGLHLSGVFLIDEPGRESPSGELARSIVGRVDIDNKGVSGVEGEYDERLAGVPGQLVRERDAQGHTIPVGRQSIEPATPGDDVVLTIDRSLQFATEQALLRQVTAVGARGARAIIQDPRTGDVLAMANVDVDPETGQPVVSSANEALTAVFEPGSVNKVITAAGAIEEGLVNPNTVLHVPDHLQVSDHLFSDHDPHAVASWSVTDIVTRSSNIGTIMIAQMLGKQRIDEYLRKFGLGDKTALDFPGESAGLMLDPKDWSGTSIGSIPIGQGISVTAMQMLEVYDVIANGGKYVAPRLVDATIDGGGARHDAPPAAQRQVVSAETAAKVNAMLQNVVASQDGTGFRAAVPGYTVAGKTGTARKPNDNGLPGYKTGAYVSSFAGYLPAENPQVSIIVVIDEPSTSIYASVVSAPLFAELANLAVRQLRVAPAAPIPSGATVQTPDVAPGTAPTPADLADAGGAPPPPSSTATPPSSSAPSTTP
jgi:cell division protein FtsI (penicillin-binding protein 3)